MKDYYKTLGISSASDKQAIRKAWLKKAFEYHPDHHPGNLIAEENFKEAQEAYRILSDPSLRLQYDSGKFKWINPDFATAPIKNHYFYALVHSKKIKCFEEVSLSFTYTGDGRIFKKPSLKNFHLTGSPLVAFRMVIHEGQRVKETSLTYTVCPLLEGTLLMEAASIKIEGKIYYSIPIEISVAPNTCYFLENQADDGKPLKLTLHYEFKKGEEP
ncbi:MAG: DnaJ domain-containing protein [Bacteroidetes bacterium]|nr:DnaJ domain-containing protein [Bacteroidota bacterium]